MAETSALQLIKPPKPVVMIGLMGAGKSRIGRELAAFLDIPFVDSDAEIVDAAGCSIADIFEHYSEKAFRDVEMRVIDRLLDGGPGIIAVGGGAYMNEAVRAKISERAISIWLRAELDILVERTGRRGGRPLLETGDPREILDALMKERHPVYAEADIIVDSLAVDIAATVNETAKALAGFLARQNDTEEQGDK